uniref:RNA polymerase II subunit B1 CTD phosphatase RPAP2 homolog n=1 Tax=Pogona vitticeps TaxID=103695 RepID=A0ABM5G8Q3_9SAUR
MTPRLYFLGRNKQSSLKNEDAAQRKAALEAAIRKKIECERKALQVVECLLEDGITEDFLLDCGKLITPAHYKDVVEERSIIKLCGYPICQNRLQNVLKQRYQISTKTNKVYDITERKCFCSNFCYRASKYFENQISPSPVWLRDEERPPDIELLQQGARGHSGKEVKLVDEDIKPLDIENPVPEATLSDSGSDSESSSDAEQEFVSSVLQENLPKVGKGVSLASQKSKLKKSPAGKACPKPVATDDAVNGAAEQLSRCHLEVLEKTPMVPDNPEAERTHSPRQSLISNTVQASEGSQLVFLGVSHKGAEHLKRLLAKSRHPVQHESRDQGDPLVAKGSLLEGLRQTFAEWRTEETLRLLYGSSFSSAHVSQQISPTSCEKEDLDEDDLDGAELLKAAAFEEDSFNSFDPSLPFKGSSTAAKPLPSYEKLKEETSQMKLKVREFYQGKFASAEEDLAAQSEKEQRHGSTEDDQQWIPVLPLVDSSAQQQIRTRIVLEKLQKVLPVVLGPLRIPLGDVYSEMKNLVKTFRLTNTNIIHKTPVWTLIAIVLLSVLSENIPMFASCQQNRGYTQFLATLLEELHFKHEDFESLTRIFKRDYLLY